jgi:hypothetical protein
MAKHFRQQALIYYPQLRYSQEYIRLSLAIALIEWLGVESYSRLLALFYFLRQRISTASHVVAVLLAHVLVMPILTIWMIQ